MAATRILLVEDDPSVRFAVRTFLEARKYEVEECDGIGRALILQTASDPDIIISDYSLPDGNALDLLEKMKPAARLTPFIILTAHASVDLAVRAIKEGAESFLTKPVELGTLEIVVERAVENRRAKQKEVAERNARLRGEVDPFIGTSSVIAAVKAEAERAALTDAPVLILGETGTGKSVLARWIHAHSERSAEAFVNLNCAGLSREFLESELFGHEKGAFTGALNAKPGLLEIGHRGTVFLDEIGDVDPQVQPKLLKVLEEKEFRRLGETKSRRVDIRLIAATHQDLPVLVRDKKFRSDLYFRINTLRFAIPALRDRREDIIPLAHSILARAAAERGRGEVHFSASTEEALSRYRWPGNIRELRNVIERALLVTEGREIGPSALSFEQPPSSGLDLELTKTLAEVEQWYITKVLEAVDGNVEAAATRLGVPRSTLYTRLKQYGMGRSSRVRI